MYGAMIVLFIFFSVFKSRKPKNIIIMITKYGSTWYTGIGMVPSIIDVWGYDREFCSSSSS